MSRVPSVLAGCLLWIALGCGSNDPRPSQSDAGKAVKASITRVSEEAMKSPKTAGTQLDLLTESLEAYARDYGGPFQEVLDAAKSARQELGDKPTGPKVESAFGKLNSAANKLP